MNSGAWRYVYTSVRGTGHIDNNLPCQDASLVHEAINSADEPMLVLVASDGAGSAARSDEGSRFVCEEVRKLLEYRFTAADFRPGDDFGTEVVRQLRGLLTTQSEDLGCALRDLACTLTAAVVLPGWAWFLQVGDGAVIVQSSVTDPLEVVFWPDNGEYANQTYFLTDVPDTHVHACLAERPVHRVSLITDGLQTLALALAERRAHPPFFQPMFGTVESAPDEGERVHVALQGTLSRFLDSPPINVRTNDDKTLILASRVQWPAPTHSVPDPVVPGGGAVSGRDQAPGEDVSLPEEPAEGQREPA